MTINLQLPENNQVLRPTITVIGVGGAGGNAVNNMIASQLEGVNFVVANTDAQALDHSLTERTIQLGAGITKGLGAGANPDIGKAAAEEVAEEIAAYVEGSNMVFITAGMGGGTGTGAAPVVARLAKEQGILTVAVVTKPFQFEGTYRMRLAESGLKELQEYVDTLIVIPNQNLFRLANESTTFAQAFQMADEVLHSGVRGVTDLMVRPGLINLDFADIRSVMREMGKAMMGTGEATGERRAIEAAEAAISNPLLDDVSLKGARALLINITGGNDMTLYEVDEAANRVREEVDPDANIIFGSTFSDEMNGTMRVSVVATGIDAESNAVSPNNQHKSFPVAEPKKAFAFTPPSSSTKQAEQAQRPATPIVRPAAFGEHSRAYMPEAAAMAARAAMESRTPPAVVRAEPRKPESAAPAQEQAQPATSSGQRDHEPEQDPAPVVHQQAMPQAPQQEQSQQYEQYPQQAAQAISPRNEYRESAQDDEGRGFLKRMADVGRAFSGRSESFGRQEVAGRVQVVQRQQAVQPQQQHEKKQEEEQYLDIPAFLRRQAN
ncbi:MAG: cell division protein FtsZ [Alphaproteobacteria bacterium]